MREYLRLPAGISVFIVFLLTMPSHVQGQSFAEYLFLGKESLARGEAYSAAYYLGECLRIDSLSGEAHFLLGEALRQAQDYPGAATAYRRSLSLKGDYSPCDAKFYLALMLKQMQQYDAATAGFRDYLERCPGAVEPMTRRARQEIISCQQALAWGDDSAEVILIHPGEEVNTPYSEFAPQQLSDSILFFSSLRTNTITQATSYIPGEDFSEIYESHISKAGWNPARLSGHPINKGRHHVANAHFTRDGRTVYFTRCVNTSTGGQQCSIYKVTRGARRWSKPELLPEPINLPGCSSTQPFLAEGDGYDLLYYASDRPGGYGGSDIWYTLIDESGIRQTVNLGSNINTPGEELSPCWFDGKLYFSSDWHAGLGGLDIFSSTGSLNRWTEPVNLRAPINSPANDLNFNFNSDSLSGYFTSNRSGSLHLGGETCCYDIYYFEYPAKEPIKPEPVPEPAKDSITELARALLPLTLYFHNDVPDPGSRSPNTRTDYLSTLEEYAGMRQQYRTAYSAGLTGDAAERARNDIDTFFSKDVQGGFEKLELLGEYILADLQQGRNVRLKVRGFASPLTTTEYNLNLTYRRIASLENYLLAYRDSILAPYTIDSNGGPRFEIIADAVGETMAAPFVSDNPNDLRNSVYSISAALERKIEITHYDAGELISQPDSFARLTFLDAEPSYNSVSGKNIIARLSFSNTGNRPFTITKVSSACDCINFSFPENLVGPGERGVIYLLIRDDVPGFYETTLRVMTSPAAEAYELPIRWTFTEK